MALQAILGDRHVEWLCQVAEQCARLQKPVIYSSVASTKFPAVACWPMNALGERNEACHVVCIFVAAHESSHREATEWNDKSISDSSDNHQAGSSAGSSAKNDGTTSLVDGIDIRPRTFDFQIPGL